MLAEVVTSGNPAIGIVIFMLGGLAGAIFYLPFKKVKNGHGKLLAGVRGVGLVVVPWCWRLRCRRMCCPC
jgi:hypothetical protein